MATEYLWADKPGAIWVDDVSYSWGPVVLGVEPGNYARRPFNITRYLRIAGSVNYKLHPK